VRILVVEDDDDLRQSVARALHEARHAVEDAADRVAASAAAIVMMTARDDIADRVRGLGSGADGYLVECLSIAELRRCGARGS